MNTIPLELGAGNWSVDAHATWNTNGARGGFDHHVRIVCAEKKG